MKMDKEKVKKLKKVMEVLSRRFLQIRPIFAGQPRYTEYSALVEIHHKIKSGKLSQDDYDYNVRTFHKLLYAYEQDNKKLFNKIQDSAKKSDSGKPLQEDGHPGG